MTVRVWRVVQTRYADAAFSGEGARLYGGRWSSAGRAVVYVAEHPGLAALEVLVHAIPQQQLRAEFCLIDALVPPELIDPTPDLPDGWAADPAGEASQGVGDRWLADPLSGPALRVPSAVVPHSSNFLLNPRHPRFAEVKVGPPQPFRFDPRLG